MNTPRKLFAALLLLLAAAPIHAAKRRAVAPPSEENISAEEWLRNHAIPFATVEPRTGIDDLRALDHIIGDARLVALGEGTHGTREFFLMKHRMLEYLVEVKGFTVFALESELADTDRVNDYIVDGKGDRSEMSHDLGGSAWSAAEILDMIDWMRAYNLARGSKPALHFRGFDSQIATGSVTALTAYLKLVDPSHADAIMQHFNCYAPYEGLIAQYRALPSATKNACRDQLQALYDAIASSRDAYIAKSDAVTYERQLHYARSIQQTEDMNSYRQGDFEARDAFMAENIDWITRIGDPGAKVIVSAHNTHVSTEEDYLMGAVLRERYFPGNEMVNFGFSFDHGSFNSIPLVGGGGKLVAFTVATPTDGIEPFFRTAAKPRFFIETRHAGSRAAREIFDRTEGMWDIGIVFDPAHASDWHYPQALAKSYDVVIWIESTSASHLTQ